MSENTDNEICSQTEFEQLKAIYDRFMQYIDGSSGIKGDAMLQLEDDIENFLPKMIEIGKKVGVALNAKTFNEIPIGNWPEIIQKSRKN
jgi:hypothetical protein